MSENAVETPEKSINAFTAFEHYDDFKGKATNTEFWSFFLLVHVVILLLMIPGLPVFFREVSDNSANNNWHAPLALALPIIIWGLIVLIPLCAVLVRRVLASATIFRIIFLILATALLGVAAFCFYSSKIGLAVVAIELLLICGGVLPGNKEEAPEA